jgi:hypothetical protein
MSVRAERSRCRGEVEAQGSIFNLTPLDRRPLADLDERIKCHLGGARRVMT